MTDIQVVIKFAYPGTIAVETLNDTIEDMRKVEGVSDICYSLGGSIYVDTDESGMADVIRIAKDSAMTVRSIYTPVNAAVDTSAIEQKASKTKSKGSNAFRDRMKTIIHDFCMEDDEPEEKEKKVEP